MYPVGLSEYLIKAVFPDFLGPTASLIVYAKKCRQDDSAFLRRWVSRATYLTTIATAALESLVHATLAITTLPLVAVRRIIWISLIGFSMLVGASFWIVHRDTLDISAAVWIKRIVIHVFLFLRVPSVVFSHLKVWSGLMRDHLIFARQATAFAIRVEDRLRRFYSFSHVEYHARQAYHLALFSVYTALFGITDPDKVMHQGDQLGLGPSLPLRPSIWSKMPSLPTLIGRTVEKVLIFVGDHFVKIGVCFLIYLAYESCGSREEIQNYLREIPKNVVRQMTEIVRRIYDWLLPPDITGFFINTQTLLNKVLQTDPSINRGSQEKAKGDDKTPQRREDLILTQDGGRA